jgi:DNA-binding NtrC family response regulator
VIEGSPTLKDARILLLEDDALISLDTEDMLMSLGAARVFVAHTIAEAESILARDTVDAAVLDLVIGSDRCEDLAQRLVSAPIPVVFASGFGDADSLPAALRTIPNVEKPYSSQALQAALLTALRPQ